MATPVQVCSPGSAQPTDLGRIVRLWGMDPSSLPPAASPSPSEDLVPFLTCVFEEAASFVDKVPTAPCSNGSAWIPEKTRTFDNSDAPVDTFKRIVPASDLRAIADGNVVELRPETWFVRRSVHRDDQKPGTASWSEWVRHLLDDGANSERAFTPSTVVHTRRIKTWACQDLKVVQGDHTWTNVAMAWEESVQKLPWPLKKRVFPVLRVTASDENHKSRAEFLVIQIALRDEGAADRHMAVVGAYTSIERLRHTMFGVEWTMGTVSDYRGRLPVWLQKCCAPRQLAKGVDVFLKWVAAQRTMMTASAGGDEGDLLDREGRRVKKVATFRI